MVVFVLCSGVDRTPHTCMVTGRGRRFSHRGPRAAGGDEALGLDAEGSVDADAGLARPIGLPATCQLQSIAKPLSVDANAVP